MNELKKHYLRTLVEYFDGGENGDDSIGHPAAELGAYLQAVSPETIIALHEQCIHTLAASAEPEEALRYYRLSYPFLRALLSSRSCPDAVHTADFPVHSLESLASKYESVLQHMDFGIMLFDHEGFVSFVNVKMAKVLGVPRKALIGMDIPNLALYNRLSRPFRKLVLAMHREMTVYRRRYHEVIDECGRRYLVTAAYGEELEGDIIVSVKEITEFKKIEQSAYQNDKLAMLGKIAAAIAHEIRNPLTSIRGFMQLLRPELVQLGKEDYARIVIEEIDRANDIIYEFLNSSKPSTPNKIEIPVGDLLKEIRLLFESEAIMKSCDILLAPIDNGLVVKGDVKQLKQVLLNIVKNSLDAIDLSSAGEAGSRERGSIRISAVRIADKAVISVSDNGIGMDYHTQAKLFDPFFTTKLEGTGLGLAVCYRIVRNHGGHIRVESTVGEGTKFIITLPQS